MKKYVYLALYFAFVSPVFAQPAGLDLSFGFGGKVVTSFADLAGNANDRLLLQPDGKLLHAYFVSDLQSRTELIRYQTNGLPDAGFGNGGIVSIPSAAAMGTPVMTDIALLPDGKFLIGMQGTETDETADFILGRINADGQLDLSFGTNGYVRTDFPGRADYLRVLKVLPGGKILAAGHSTDPDGSVFFSVARYLPDGSPDPTFGIDGLSWFRFPPGYRTGRASVMELLPDGMIILAGTLATDENTWITLVRLERDGMPDGGFGTGGSITSLPMPPSLDVIDGAMQANEQIVLLARLSDSPGHSMLTRFDTRGSFDLSFGTGGTWFSEPSSSVELLSLAVLPDRKILSAGFSYGPNGKRMVLACHTPEGKLLTDFGNNGYITTEIGDSNGMASALVVQPDHKVVVAGSARKNGTRASVAARYFSGPLTVNEVEGIAQTALLYPNPTQGELTLSYTLTAAQTLKLDLLDVTGKVEVTFPNLVKPAGKYEEQLHLPETLPVGTYYLLIASDKGHTALPLVKR